MRLIDLSKVTLPMIKAGIDKHVTCPDCDGKGCEDCNDTGIVEVKRCRSCKEWMLLEQFYGQDKKQSRCIPCYKATYGSDYRRALREARNATD